MSLSSLLTVAGPRRIRTGFPTPVSGTTIYQKRYSVKTQAAALQTLKGDYFILSEALTVPELSNDEIQFPSICFFILADEPTGALDTKTGEQALELLSEIRHESNMTMIMVTHNRDVALQADRVIELIDGRLCKEVYPKAIGIKEATEILESHACNLEDIT